MSWDAQRCEWCGSENGWLWADGTDEGRCRDCGRHAYICSTCADLVFDPDVPEHTADVCAGILSAEERMREEPRR